MTDAFEKVTTLKTISTESLSWRLFRCSLKSVESALCVILHKYEPSLCNLLPLQFSTLQSWIANKTHGPACCKVCQKQTEPLEISKKRKAFQGLNICWMAVWAARGKQKPYIDKSYLKFVSLNCTHKQLASATLQPCRVSAKSRTMKS